MNYNVDPSWLTLFTSNLPDFQDGRKSFIEIAGYPTWENVNSNLLAFYFDENEEHKFGRLFMDSLLEIISQNQKDFDPANFDSPFAVAREAIALRQKRIDILITSDYDFEQDSDQNDTIENLVDSWALIIENKIKSNLYNDLNLYWKSVKAEQKVGIVLSATRINLPLNKNPKGKFINITHSELVAKVQRNLSSYFLDSDDRHLLMLKEYISHVQYFTPNPQKNISMNQTLKLFQENKQEIEQLKQADRKLLEHIFHAWKSSFKQVGYKPSSNRLTGRKHFYLHKKKFLEKGFLVDDFNFGNKFRFFAHFSRMRFENTFKISFELYNKENTKYGSELIQRLSEKGIFQSSALTKGNAGSDSSSYYHIFYLHVKINSSIEDSIENQIIETIKKHLMNDHKNILQMCFNELRDIIESGSQN